jgi:hypothetical protein
MKLGVVVFEPFELVADSDELVTVTGDVSPQEISAQRCVVDVLPGSVLGDHYIEKLILQPRLVGHPLTGLKEGRVVAVNGAAYPAPGEGQPFEFIGDAVPLERHRVSPP